MAPKTRNNTRKKRQGAPDQIAVTIPSSDNSDSVSQSSVSSSTVPNALTMPPPHSDQILTSAAHHSFFAPLNLNIQPFDGDPALLNFFFDQLNDLAKCNRWNEEQTFVFFKSKLIGNALKYYLESPHLKSVKSLAEIKHSFSNFFAPLASTTSICEISNFKMLPNESITSLAHRIDLLVCKVYSNITDPASLDQLKFIQFLNAVPSELKFVLHEECISTYQVAVSRAIRWQQSRVSAGQTDVCTNYITSNISVNAITDSTKVQSKVACQICQSILHGARDCPIFLRPSTSHSDNTQLSSEQHSSHFRPQKSERHPYARNNNCQKFNSTKSKKNNNSELPTCQFCDIRGHVMRNCFQFKRQYPQYKTESNSYSTKYSAKQYHECDSNQRSKNDNHSASGTNCTRKIGHKNSKTNYSNSRKNLNSRGDH